MDGLSLTPVSRSEGPSLKPGSTHGTFVDEHRLSEAKTASRPTRLSHLSKLTIGTTTFNVHMHEQWPCDICQLGNDNEIRLDTGEAKISSVAPVSTSKGEHREAKRQEEMAQLKARLLSGHESTPTQSGYLDRSAIRRALHPPSRRSASPPQVALVDPESLKPSGPSVFATKLLAAHGWTPGTGLGKDGSGRAEPLNVEQRVQRSGLGTSEELNWRQRGKQRRYKDY